MEKTAMGLAAKLMKSRFRVLKGSLSEMLKGGKIKAERVLDRLDLNPGEGGVFFRELWTDARGMMDDATKEIMVAGLKRDSMEQKISFVESLSPEDKELFSTFSPEMKVIVFHCSRLLQEREKMIFSKVRTVEDLSELSQKLGLATDLSSYPPDALVIGSEKKKGENLLVEFYLERGDYGKKMVLLASISAALLYK